MLFRSRPPRSNGELLQVITRKGPFIDEIFLLVLAAAIALFLVIRIGRLDLPDQPKLIEPMAALGPLNVIILVITFSESSTLRMAMAGFGRRSCWAFVSAHSLER